MDLIWVSLDLHHVSVVPWVPTSPLLSTRYDIEFPLEGHQSLVRKQHYALYKVPKWLLRKNPHAGLQILRGQ